MKGNNLYGFAHSILRTQTKKRAEYRNYYFFVPPIDEPIPDYVLPNPPLTHYVCWQATDPSSPRIQVPTKKSGKAVIPE